MESKYNTIILNIITVKIKIFLIQVYIASYTIFSRLNLELGFRASSKLSHLYRNAVLVIAFLRKDESRPNCKQGEQTLPISSLKETCGWKQFHVIGCCKVSKTTLRDKMSLLCFVLLFIVFVSPNSTHLQFLLSLHKLYLPGGEIRPAMSPHS